MDIKKEFGERVKELRKLKGLSQEKLAEKSHLHYTYIGAIERAEKNITLEAIQKIAAGLEIDMPALFYFSEEGKDKLILQINKELSIKKKGQLYTILKIIKSL